MSYQVLARKYRPQKFSDVIGQDHVTRTLKNAITQDRVAHGYIFSGHRGIGKTTVARILAMALNCRSEEHPVPEPCGICESCTEIRAGNSVDVIEIDAATNRGIDEIRELREAARYRPARDRFKIYILDEAHQITDAAFNALLKTLEEPPSHVVFMMATTQPEDIPQTIRSRCQHFSFRAVKFEEILTQLADLTARENVVADRDALALLAEAGDGSIRDALSILDQAIASSRDGITVDAVRQLIGTAPASVMEGMMQAVINNSSQDILQAVDELIGEGHSPTHLARQLVRFLRNTVVAKVAGENSALLQVSSDERARIARVAEWFSEEDLARHLQIMLRTHGELGYRQEQRFHLELGLLKMTHAQRLLPLEQLLSGAAVAAPARAAGRAAERASERAAETRPISTAPSARTPAVSPFAADSARKTNRTPEMASETKPVQSVAKLDSGGSPVILESGVSPVIMGSAAPAVEVAVEVAAANGPQAIRDSILDALTDAGQQMAVSMLEAGDWTLEGNQLVVRVASSSAVIDMTVGADTRRIAGATASGRAGRPIRFTVLPGGTEAAVEPRSTGSSGGRGRMAQDPVVRRLQEKFGAEIRTVIDYREKN